MVVGSLCLRCCASGCDQVGAWLERVDMKMRVRSA